MTFFMERPSPFSATIGALSARLRGNQMLIETVEATMRENIVYALILTGLLGLLR